MENKNCYSATIGYDSEFWMKEQKQGNFKESVFKYKQNRWSKNDKKSIWDDSRIYKPSRTLPFSPFAISVDYLALV